VAASLTKAALEPLIAEAVPLAIAGIFNVSVTDFVATATMSATPAPTPAPTPAGDGDADSAMTSRLGLSIVVSAAMLVGTLCM